MIPLKNETEDLLLSKILETVERLLNKLIQNQQKPKKINLHTQEKHFTSVQQLKLKDLG